jgi:periplasmic copper chaperone A
MKHLTHRRNALRTGLALGGALLLPSARAHEFFTGNLTVIHPWTRATAPGATTAIVSLTFEEVTTTDRLVGALTPMAAAAELGGAGAPEKFDYEIPEGVVTEFTEAGVHLRLLGLREPLMLGREYPLTLVFAKAGAIRAALLIDYPPLA